MNELLTLLQAKLDEAKSKGNINSDIKRIESQINKLKIQAEIDPKAISNLVKQLESVLNQKINITNINVDVKNTQKIGEQIGNNIAQGVSKGVDKATKQLNKIQLSTDITKIENDYKRFGIVSQEVENNLKELKIARENALKAEGTDRASAEIEKYNQKLAETKSSWKELQATQVSANQRTAQMTSMQEWMRKNQKATKLCGDQVQKLIQECHTCDKVRFDGIKNEFKELQVQAGKAGKLGNTLWGSIVEQGKSFIQWTSVSGLVMSVWHSFKQGAINVKELGDSLLELEKVSDLSASGLEKVAEEAYKLGDTVGKTGRQVIDATTEFKRAGYDMQDSLDMSEAALIMTNVAEGITETSDAAGTLISVLKGFNMAESEVMSIVDMMNSTSNQSPIGFDQLAEGLERTAGTLAQSGNTIQETIGLLTAGYAQLRNVEKISQGLITISARIRGVGEDGETIDGMSAKMSEDFGKIGVAVENADGSLRNIYQIAQDYSKVLPTLTDKQKQYYAELAAGKHQVTVWNAIVQQFQDAEKATAQAIDSVGSASEENQKYLESISGKISIFLSAVERLSSTVVDSDLLKFFVDLGTIGVKSVDGLIESIGTLGTVGVGAMGFLGAKGHGLTDCVTIS